MYGTGLIDLDAPAEIFRFRPMPCTPAGDFIGVVSTGERALQYMQYMIDEDMSVESAKEYLARQP